MNKIFVIDASGYLYRSYFAIREMTNSKGESTNALYGFIRCLFKLIKDFTPTHLVCVFDGPRNAQKRIELYADYKANRRQMPADLRPQIERAREFCQLMGIAFLNIAEVEADDTMASIAKWAYQNGDTTYLCTGDKDMGQVVNERIFLLNTFKDNFILGIKEVEKQFGVTPDKMVDFLAMTGDTSDNIPGLPGFGPKTAADLLNKFGSLDSILECIEEIPGKKKQETLRAEKEKALISRKLVTVDSEVAFPKELDYFKLGTPLVEQLREFYSQMNFLSFTKELEKLMQPSALVEEEEKCVFHLIDRPEALQTLLDSLSKEKEICLKVICDCLQPMRAQIIGIALASNSQETWYLSPSASLSLEQLLQPLKVLLESCHHRFYGHDIKFDFQILKNYGIEIACISFDTILASYLLYSHGRQHSLDYLVSHLLKKTKSDLQEITGKGKKQLALSSCSAAALKNYYGEEVHYIFQLKKLLEKQLFERNLSKLLFELELPLLSILAQMERKGIFIEVSFLQNLSLKLATEIKEVEQEVYKLAGESFNLNSPKQVSAILFDKQGIKPPKKTATGLSTNADVLESLKENHPIAAHLLEYRALEKLRSTYIDALPLEVNPCTKRIHCKFNQSVTATGRLASQEPNLQNIPVRTELGRNIRKAFRPQKQGWSYLAADYSQIELRLLAHLSQDPILMKAFESQADIHTYTASVVFDIPLEKVTREQRYQAKTVNFGILYGQQAFGLARELKIDVKKAAAFIHTYFERYSKIKEFIENCKEAARQSGKAVTLLGRERLIPEINSHNMMVRSAAERLAVNMPIQGSQADIIKLAMLEIDRCLRAEKKEAFLILQIHDELIFELPDSEIDSLTAIVKRAMENVLKLKVPLIVDINVGKNWQEC